MRTIRSNAKQIYRELYNECDWKDEVSFREYVETDMDNNPTSWNWLFNEDEVDLTFSDLTEREKEMYNDFMKSLEDE